MFEYILIGIIGGIIAGMGMGGGTLTIPLLTIFPRIPQKTAQGVNLIAFVPMAVVSLAIHTKNGLVDYKHTYIMAIIGVVFSVASSLLVVNMPNKILKKIFAVFLIGLAIYQFCETWKKSKHSAK